MNIRLLTVIILFGVFSLLPHQLFAAARTWDGGGSDGTCGGGVGDGNKWSCAANWSSDTTPTSADSAVFNGTSTKDATIDASFQGTLVGLTISSGYTGTITQARSLTINGTYSQADGIFTGNSSAIDINGSYSLTAGTFTSTSGTMTIDTNLTISGSPTFTANGGTVTFDGSSGGSLACNSATFNRVVISKGVSFAFTIGSACTLPLGNSPTSAGLITNNGTITTGTGTWTISDGNYIQNNGSTLTMTGTALTISNGSITLNGGVFPAGLTTLSIARDITNTANLLPDGINLTMTGTSASALTCGTVTWGSVTISKGGSATLTVGSSCTLPLGNSPTSSAAIVNNGTITTGTGTWTISGISYTQNNGSTLTMGGTALSISDGDLTLNGGVFPAGLTTLTVGRNLTNTGNLLPDGINLTMTGTSASALTCGTVTWGSVTISKGGSATLTVGSSCTLPLGNSPTSSAAIVNNGTITTGTGTWTISGISYTQNNGSTLTMGGTAMTVTDGDLTLNGGVFPAGLTTLTVGRNITNTGNLLPNGIALSLTGSGQNSTLTCGTVTWGSVSINKSTSGAIILSSDCTVTGNFTRTDGAINNPGSARVFYIGGNLSVSTTDTFGGANLTIELNGSGSQSITQNAGTISTPFRINKTGTATLLTNLVLGSTLDINAGTFSQGATFNLTTGGATTVGASGVWSNTGTGDISLAGGVTNSGSITLDGSGAGCGGADAIAISSSASPTQRTWSGAGTFSITDVSVSDMAGSITARSSTNTSNNAWTFLGCNTTPSDPTSLGAASYVNGSWGNDNTPTLSFTLSDPDGSDTVKFQIQIDDTSDFSSVLVDYTSALAAQGATSFSVGQAAGGGTYTTGSGSQTLSDSSGYYWKVKAIDNSDAASSFSTANSGAIAFKIDTVAPTPGSLSVSSLTTTSITISVSGASDGASGLATTPYNFQNTTAVTSSGAQSGTTWASSGLSVNTQYTFQVTTTDLASNSANSSTFNAYTAANPPSSLVLTVNGTDQITADWSVNSNPAGTEFFAENTTASTNSSWIADAVSWVSSGLTSSTLYSFSIKARNGDNVETSAITDSVTTNTIPPPSIQSTPLGGGIFGAIISGPNTYLTLLPILPPTPLPTPLPISPPPSNDTKGSSNDDKRCVNYGGQLFVPPTILFSKNLKKNSVGPDVKALQIFLNSNGFIVSESGSGSIGHETNTYGDNTRDALMRFQIRYAKEIGNNGKSGNLETPTRNFINKLYNLKKSICSSPVVITPAINDLPQGGVTNVEVVKAPLTTGTNIATSTPTVTTNTPTTNDQPINVPTIISNESTSTVVITGWAVDPDLQNLPIIVTTYINEIGGQYRVIIATTTANIENLVVNIDNGYDGNHGFELRIPIPQNLSSFSTYVFATDAEDKSVNVLLPGSEIPPPNFPVELVIDSNRSLFKNTPTESSKPPSQNNSQVDTKSSVVRDNSNDAYEYFTNVISSQISYLRGLTNNSNLKLLEIIVVSSSLLVSLILLLTPLLSGASLNNYLLYLGVLVLQFFGVKKESKPWGTVYSSLTKKPVSFTRVEILDEQARRLESVVSDVNGRYGFLVSERISASNAVELEAFQKNFTFPSKIETSSFEKVFYPNIYKGGFLNIQDGVANFDLPMDPQTNKQILSYFSFVSMKLNTVIMHLINILFVAGVIFGLVSLIVSPNPINFVLIFVVLITYLLRRFGFKLKPFGLTIDSYTKQIMPFSFVALYDMSGRRINFTVSDEKGRYFMLTKKGDYSLRAYTPSHVEPLRQTETIVKTKKGWISIEIHI